MRHTLAAFTLLLALGATRPVLAAALSDEWLEGYAAAILERELKLPVASLHVENGVLNLTTEALSAVDRARVQALLAGIRGVTRVELAAVPAGTPAPPPPTGPPRGLFATQQGLSASRAWRALNQSTVHCQTLPAMSNRQ